MVADDELVLGRPDPQLPRVGQVAVGENQRMDDFVFAAGEIQRLVVRGEAHAVKRRVDDGPRDDPVPAADERDDHDLVVAIAAMEDGEELTGRVELAVDGEVAGLGLRAGRAKPPLVRQLGKPVSLRAGLDGKRLRRGPGRGRLAPGGQGDRHAGQDERKAKNTQSRSRH
jgi:hypothetical protein